jgi:sensor histidine kinase YesM
VIKGDKENASLYLKRFAKLVRLIVENAETTQVSLENEISLIESYIQLEELRFSGKINYSIQVDETIEKDTTFLPPMVLQPFVENAIWHGLMHKEKNELGNISIAIRENEDTLVCTIEDNGIGRTRSQELKENSLIKTKSLGMKITEERLKLLSKAVVNEFIRVVDLKDANDVASGTRVEINIPIS